MQDHFDVVQIFRSVNKVELLTKLILSQRQEHFLPVLKFNVLSGHPPKDEKGTWHQQEGVEGRSRAFIRELSLRQASSKIDKRILKYVNPPRDHNQEDKVGHFDPHMKISENADPSEIGTREIRLAAMPTLDYR